MKVSVLTFGIAREILNGSSVEIEISSTADAGELKRTLEEKYPRLKELKSFMIAVNDEYALPTQRIAEGDEIAVIPPVSGG